MAKKKPIQDVELERSKMSETDDYVDGKREYVVVRDFVNKYSGKHCPLGSRVFLSDERAAVLTELGCVALVPPRVIRRP